MNSIQNAIEMNLFGNLHEVVHVLGTPDPHDMAPVMRNGEIALTGEALFLNIAPIVIGTPDNTAGKAWFEGDSTGAIVTAK